MRLLALLTTLASGCTWVTLSDLDTALDRDGDRVPRSVVEGEGDCDDDDPTVFAWTRAFADTDQDGAGDPDAPTWICGEAPAGFVLNDSDCDDSDASVQQTRSWFTDADGDGFGDPAAGAPFCGDPGPGLVLDSRDCDDADPAVWTETVWFPDEDADGFGDPQRAETSCTAPGDIWGPDAGDCDDTDATIHPDALERCGGGDEDCDGQFDDDDDQLDASTLLAWHPDADADGDPTEDALLAVLACAAPDPTYGPPGTDCDDADPARSGLVVEMCNGVDDDCDGAVDEDSPDTLPYAEDLDGDGIPGLEPPIQFCTPPSGWVLLDPAAPLDCNDADPAVFPGAPDTWYDGVDSDCAGNDDYDADSDGFVSDGFAGTDCDDADDAIHPDAVDIPYDGVDANCDQADDYDVDGDGYRAESEGFDDCNDNQAAVNPGAAEVPYDNLDDNCDPSDDDDADGDGVDGPSGIGPDCDDDAPLVSPNQPEIYYDGIDQDCDGLADDDDQDGDGVPFMPGDRNGDCDDADPAVGVPDPWFPDEDGDGFFADAPVFACTAPPSSSPVLVEPSDCDDKDSLVNPDADEVFYDDRDDNCLPADDDDADGDGESADFRGGTDCDDADPTTFDAATERCDAVDHDCDGDTLPAGPSIWVTDGAGNATELPALPLDAFEVTPYVRVDVCGDHALALVDRRPAGRFVLQGHGGARISSAGPPVLTWEEPASPSWDSLTWEVRDLHLSGSFDEAVLSLARNGSFDDQYSGYIATNFPDVRLERLDFEDVIIGSDGSPDGDDETFAVVRMNEVQLTMRDVAFRRNQARLGFRCDTCAMDVANLLVEDGIYDYLGMRVAFGEGPWQGVQLLDNTSSNGALQITSWGNEHQTRLVGVEASGNHASDVGGAMGIAGRVALESSTFSQNTAVVGGGALRTDGTEFPVLGVQFLDNSSSADGGAVWSSLGATKFENCLFRGNTAGADGGALWAGAAMRIEDSTIDMNTASGRGGGVYGDTSTLWIDRVLLSNNTAVDGGAIGIAYTSLTLVGPSVLENNFALGPAGAGGILVNAPYVSVVAPSNQFLGNSPSTVCDDLTSIRSCADPGLPDDALVCSPDPFGCNFYSL